MKNMRIWEKTKAVYEVWRKRITTHSIQRITNTMFVTDGTEKRDVAIFDVLGAYFHTKILEENKVITNLR